MDETNEHLIQVVAGVNVKYINSVPHVLLGLKPRGVWEFPGGKIEPNESHSKALEREWMEELGVNVFISDERFGHALNGAYEIWFYEVEVDEFDNEEPTAKEHVEVEYFRLTDDNDGVGKLNMNGTNRAMISKLINSYS
jgi:8-oxo-dGTP pyrophosphatase MutT (NUDIX family)